MYKKLPDDFSLICDLRSSTQFNTSAELLRWIKNSALSNNVHLFKNTLGVPSGYILWANVNKETLAKIKRSSAFPLHFYEWNEGYITLVLDILITDGWTAFNRSQLMSFLRKRKILAYVRDKKLSLLVRKNWLHRKLKILKD